MHKIEFRTKHGGFIWVVCAVGMKLTCTESLGSMFVYISVVDAFHHPDVYSNLKQKGNSYVQKVHFDLRSVRVDMLFECGKIHKRLKNISGCHMLYLGRV